MTQNVFPLMTIKKKQVLNHGIDAGLIEEVMAVAREFFRLPPEEKAKLYSDDPARKMRLSTSFNVRKETVHNWRDYLRLHCHPLDQFVPDWPSNPPDFKYVLYMLRVSFPWYTLQKFLSFLVEKEAKVISNAKCSRMDHDMVIPAGEIISVHHFK
jgi:hypothetical protein